MRQIFFILLLVVLIYTRFVNLGWGLPYPMHPDERNMVSAVQQLSCPSLSALATCLNPHFFAYGQFPLYLAYGGVQIYHLIFGLIGQPTYDQATIALRTFSALSSILLALVLQKTVELIHGKKEKEMEDARFISLLLFIFSPYAIQFAHFGTTESILMLFYSLIVYLSLLLLRIKNTPLHNTHMRSLRIILLLAIISGLALGTKISSLLFLGVPIAVLFLTYVVYAIDAKKGAFSLFLFAIISLFFFIISSPHNLLNWNDFISSITYESRVGLGRFVAFYTRQFVDTPPLLFQITKILPYVLGWPQFIAGILGFFLLPSKLTDIVSKVMRFPRSRKLRVTESAKIIDILRFSLLLSFFPSSFFFSKWTRFISPSFPLFSLFAALFVLELYKKYKHKIVVQKGVGFLFIILLLPGVAFLSIYATNDVRFTASDWMKKNIPANSKILSETANAIDLPVATPNTTPSSYVYNSFNFYDLDQSSELQANLNTLIKQADYIIVPTRRIFYNHTCFISNAGFLEIQKTEQCKNNQNTYPLLNSYYRDLFSGTSGFQKVAEFSSFPKLSIMGKVLQEFPDESAEETWTVFDHPVVRIYKKIIHTSQASNDKTAFSSYQTTTIKLMNVNYKLLIADTPEKWELGLMYVKNRQDINQLDGMVFIFPDREKRQFWNKNTISNLQLYWIDDRKVIGQSFLPSINSSKDVVTVSSPGEATKVIELLQ